MPCDSISNLSIEWGEHTITDLLVKAMAKEGYQLRGEATAEVLQFAKQNDYYSSVTYNTRTHEMDVRQSRYGEQFDEIKIKRGYAAELVQHTAQRFGWQLEQKTDTKFVARRRF